MSGSWRAVLKFRVHSHLLSPLSELALQDIDPSVPRASSRLHRAYPSAFACLREPRLCGARADRSTQRKVPRGREDAERLTADVTVPALSAWPAEPVGVAQPATLASTPALN